MDSAAAEEERTSTGEGPLVVRAATADDGPRMARLLQSHFNWINVWHTPHSVFHRNVSDSWMEQTVADFPAVVAEDDDQMIGFAISRPQEPFLIELRHIYVDDPYRNLGIGSLIIQQFEEVAKHSYYRMVMATSSAHWYPTKTMPTRLFAKAGYEVRELEPGTELYLRTLTSAPKFDIDGESTGVPEIRLFNFMR
jgi:GNAT superfamily N-acetyltransferase